jgi:signal transduction histidine kinase
MAVPQPVSPDDLRANAQAEGVRLAARTLRSELRNTLATTRGWAELLAEDPTLPDHARHAAAAILVSTARAVNTMNNLARRTRVEKVHWGAGVAPTIRLPQPRPAPRRERE